MEPYDMPDPAPLTDAEVTALCHERGVILPDDLRPAVAQAVAMLRAVAAKVPRRRDYAAEPAAVFRPGERSEP